MPGSRNERGLGATKAGFDVSGKAYLYTMKPIGTYFLAAIATPLIAFGIAVAVFLNTFNESTDFDTQLYLCLLLFVVIIMLLNGLIVGLAHRETNFRKKLRIWTISLFASLVGILFDYAVKWTVDLF